MRRRTPVQMGLNIASMIDVVFLLLIYFMVATDFSPAEETFRMDLPDRRIGSEAFSLKDTPLRVEVLAPGARAKPLYNIPGYGVPTGSVVSLQQQLANLRGEGGAAKFTPDHPVEILVSPSAGWAGAVEAFNAAITAGYSNVRIDERGGS